jgi:ribosomal protein S18 acetylase RimI-like enzyme
MRRRPSAPERARGAATRKRRPPGRTRSHLEATDRAQVESILRATKFFSPAEITIGLELVDAGLETGAASGYRFLLLERDGRLRGYACYGPIPGTRASYDLYWIAVEPSSQGHRVGAHLLRETERRIRRQGGRRVYVDTSTRPQYTPTRAFYERCGYRVAALLEDFYAPGDGKAIYLKVLNRDPRSGRRSAASPWQRRRRP